MEVYPAPETSKNTDEIIIQTPLEAEVVVDCLGPFNRIEFKDAGDFATQTGEWPFGFELTRGALNRLARKLGKVSSDDISTIACADNAHASIEQYLKPKTTTG